MSAITQIDESISKIIIDSFNFLRFRKFFEYYDRYRSKNSEYLDAVTHANEFQQLRQNHYYPQTMENLQTCYGEIFQEISKKTLNLECNHHQIKEMILLKKNLEKLSFSNKYLQEKIFTSESTSHLGKNNTPSCSQFISEKNKLISSIDQYIRQKN